MTTLFPSSFWTLISIGMALHLVGYFWLLFAAYREDIHLARLMVFIPAVSLLFAGRHPRVAIVPSILQLIGFVLCAAINDLWAVVTPH